MADPAYEQAADGLGAKLITGQREDEGAGDIPESSAGHGQERTVMWSAQVLNRGFARRNCVGHKRSPFSEALLASHSALPPDLGRWEKPGLSVDGSATMRSGASAARVEGTVNSSRECVMAFIRRLRIGVVFVLAYALAWGATLWNGFFAPGVLLAALIVVMLTEGLGGLMAPAGMAARTRHRARAEREELR